MNVSAGILTWYVNLQTSTVESSEVVTYKSYNVMALFLTGSYDSKSVLIYGPKALTVTSFLKS